jgi:putative transposase
VSNDKRHPTDSARNLRRSTHGSFAQRARTLLANAVEAEVTDFLGQHADLKDPGRRLARRPPRSPAGARGDDRHRSGRRSASRGYAIARRAAADPGRIRFSPSILPPYMRRSKSDRDTAADLGISTSDFSEALAALLGKDAAGLSPPPSAD